jgi:hypothetical protein
MVKDDIWDAKTSAGSLERLTSHRNQRLLITRKLTYNTASLRNTARLPAPSVSRVAKILDTKIVIP